jgi:Flp pilus assembly pilin Flp
MTRWAGGVPPKITGEEDGQALAEYAMILLFVAVACVAVVTLLGVPIRGFYTGFNGSF